MGSREVCITGLDRYLLSILDSYNHLGVRNLLSILKHITPDGFQVRLFKFLFLRLDTLPRWSFITRRTLLRWSGSCVSSATFCAFLTALSAASLTTCSSLTQQHGHHDRYREKDEPVSRQDCQPLLVQLHYLDDLVDSQCQERTRPVQIAVMNVQL